MKFLTKNNLLITLSCLLLVLITTLLYSTEIAQILACHEDEWVKRVEQTKKKIIASSTLASEGGYTYNVENVLDENPETCWCPQKGRNGNGADEFIIMKIPYGIKGIRIINGLANKDLFYENNRVKKLYLGWIAKENKELKDSTKICSGEYLLGYNTTIGNEIYLKDTFNKQDIIFSRVKKNFNWENEDIFKHKENIYLVIGIAEIYKGTKYNDTCISDIEIIR